jgi:rare lipoprotein A
MKLLSQAAGVLVTLLLISACQQSGRYSQRVDSAPTTIPATIATQDATPHFEPYRKLKSRAYTVLGKRYFPMDTGKGFEEYGDASWYGQKFHGHLTSIGETYDMYAMTAAHKTLPLPSFVRVTNQINNKQVIVRINDRGPFHGKRIIDLSYAAAKKLDYLKTGTAPVKVEVIHFDQNNRVTVGKGPTLSYAEYAGIAPSQSPTKPPIYIQVVALSNKQQVANLLKELTSKYRISATTQRTNGVYRLRLGPVINHKTVNTLLVQLHNDGFPEAFVVTAD